MEFRTMSLPEDKVYWGVLNELMDMVQKHVGTCYRHFVMICVWNMVKLLGRGEVPVRIVWPTDMIVAPELEPWSDAFEQGNLTHLMLAGGNQDVAFAGMMDEIIGTWMALKSVELSDTPCWYRPSEDLCYLLAATKLSGVYVEDVQLPYPAFWLELPKGLLKTETARGWHDVRCAGISTGVPPAVEPPAGRRLIVVLVQEPLHGDDGLDDVSYDSSTFPLAGEEPLEVVLQQEHDRYRPPDGGGNFRAQIFGSETNMEGMRNVLFNLVLGFILYLRERNAQVLALPPKEKAKGKDRRGLAEMKRVLTGRTWLVGTKIRLSPIIRQAVREGGGSISHHHKTVVPGHSQRYRIGPRTDWHYEFRRKDPYVRGGDGPILGHSYESSTQEEVQ